MLRTGIFCVIGLASVASLAQGANRVGAPVALRAGDELINVDIGHAAPFVGDIDNDGQIDLLVGQFGGGKLRIHRGLGEGQFASMEWFQAAGQEANVPAG